MALSFDANKPNTDLGRGLTPLTAAFPMCWQPEEMTREQRSTSAVPAKAAAKAAPAKAGKPSGPATGC